MDSGRNYSRSFCNTRALAFNQSKYSNHKRTIPSLDIKPKRDVVHNYRQDQISRNEYTSADDSVYEDIIGESNLRAPNYTQNSYHTGDNYKDRNVYDIHENSITRDQLRKARCFYKYSNNEEQIALEDRYRRNQKYINDRIQADNIYVRPLTEYYNREYLYKTLENKKKMQGLARNLVSTREREKQKTAWDIYIKKLKIKHNVFDDSQPEPSTSNAMYRPKTRIDIDTINDYYNTRFETAPSSHCKELLRNMYSHSIETDRFSTQSSKHTNEYFENNHQVNITNSHTNIHTTAAKIRNVTFINTERNINTPYDFKLNPYLGLPNSFISTSQNPYFSYACSSSGRELKQNARDSCDLGAPKGRVTNIDQNPKQSLKKTKTASSRYLMTRSGGNRTSTLKTPKKSIKLSNTRPARLSVTKSNKLNPERTSNGRTRNTADGNTKRLSTNNDTRHNVTENTIKHPSNIGNSREIPNDTSKRPSVSTNRNIADDTTNRPSNITRRSIVDNTTRRFSYGMKQENKDSMKNIAQKLDLLIAGNEGMNNLKSIDNKLDVLIEQMTKLLNNKNSLETNVPKDDLRYYRNERKSDKYDLPEIPPSGCGGLFCPCESEEQMYPNEMNYPNETSGPYNNKPEQPMANIEGRFYRLPCACKNKSSSDSSNQMNDVLHNSTSSISCSICNTCCNDNEVVQALPQYENKVPNSSDNNYACCMNGKQTDVINVTDLLKHITTQNALPSTPKTPPILHQNNETKLIDGSNQTSRENANNISNGKNNDKNSETKINSIQDPNNIISDANDHSTNGTNKITNNNMNNRISVGPNSRAYETKNGTSIHSDDVKERLNKIKKHTTDDANKNTSNIKNNRNFIGTNNVTSNCTTTSTNRDKNENIHETPGLYKDGKFRLSKSDKYYCVTIDKCTSISKGRYSNSASIINEILLEERDKSNKAKQDIEGILNGNGNRTGDMEIKFDFPTKECCTEVTNSLSKAIIQEDSSIESTEIAAVFPNSTRKRITIAVNTDPLSLLALLKISTATFGRLLSFVNFDYQSLLPLLSSTRPIINRFNCNVCGLSFERSTELSEHTHEHVLKPNKQCCVYCHTTRNRPGMFKCRYCGRSFTRAYCRELHETDCAKKGGLQHDVPENLAILT